MAKRTVTVVTDDLDGSEAAETVKFSIDGMAYEIDLTEAHASEMRAVFAPYVANGQKVNGSRVASGRSVVTRTPGMPKAADEEARRNRNGLIRSWFNGLPSGERARIYDKHAGAELGDKGRVPEDIVKAYDNRDKAPAPVVKAVPAPAPVATFTAPSEAPSAATETEPASADKPKAPARKRASRAAAK